MFYFWDVAIAERLCCCSAWVSFGPKRRFLKSGAMSAYGPGCVKTHTLAKC